MKQPAVQFTRDAFSKSSRGRPRKPDAKSNAQRQREFRQCHKFDFLISVTRNEKEASE